MHVCGVRIGSEANVFSKPTTSATPEAQWVASVAPMGGSGGGSPAENLEAGRGSPSRCRSLGANLSKEQANGARRQVSAKHACNMSRAACAQQGGPMDPPGRTNVETNASARDAQTPQSMKYQTQLSTILRQSERTSRELIVLAQQGGRVVK